MNARKQVAAAGQPTERSGMTGWRVLSVRGGMRGERTSRPKVVPRYPGGQHNVVSALRERYYVRSNGQVAIELSSRSSAQCA